MYYCDSSAVAKLVLEEDFSSDVEHFLAEGVLRVSSTLMRVELARTVARRAPQLSLTAVAVGEGFELLEISPEVLSIAATLPPATLRTLDAIHLATASLLRSELTAFVSYDERLLEAAAAFGLPVASPGLG